MRYSIHMPSSCFRIESAIVGERCRKAFAILVASCGALVGMTTGCSTPNPIPSKYDLPAILDVEIPSVQRAILKYAKEHGGRLPDTSMGEQTAMRAIGQRFRTEQETDAGGDSFTVEQSIDGVAYIFRPAKDTFILTVGGHVTRTPTEGGSAGCTWFSFQGRYTNSGEVVIDQTSYLENDNLFIDAMRSTSNRGSWNSSAWAISKIYLAVAGATGKEFADATVDGFVKDAVASGLARVPSDMTPRDAAFGGVKSTPTKPSQMSR